MLKPDHAQARLRKLAAAIIMAAPTERVLLQWNQFVRQTRLLPPHAPRACRGAAYFCANRSGPTCVGAGLGGGSEPLAHNFVVGGSSALIEVIVLALGDRSIVITRACFEPATAFLVFGSTAAWADGFAAGTGAADAVDGFCTDFAIEILRSVHAAPWPHHRRPTSVRKPAGAGSLVGGV